MFTWLDPVLKWIGTFLGWLDKITGNYMIALFLFAIIAEILLLPIGIKQQKNAIKQAKLRPKEMAIKKKYAGRMDSATQQKMQKEMQELYQRENFNQLSGCLPALLQLPIIIALYQIVLDPLKYVVHLSATTITAIQTYIADVLKVAGTTGNRGTIHVISIINENGIDAFSGLDTASFTELSSAYAKGLPNFNTLGFNLGETPSIKDFSWLWLIPVLTFVVYFFSMRLTRKLSYQSPMAENQQAGCSNTVMDVSMPLMSVVITFMMPAAIGIYWIFKSIIGTLKQFLLKLAMPFPVFTEEDYKEAERKYLGKSVKRKSGESDNDGNIDPNAPKKRSLHHIDDDDDYDAVYLGKGKPVTHDKYDDDVEETVEPAGESGKNGLVETAPIKDDGKSRREKKSKKKNDNADNDSGESDGGADN